MTKNIYHPSHIEDMGGLRYRVVEGSKTIMENVSWSTAVSVAMNRNQGYAIPSEIKKIIRSNEKGN